MDSLADIKQERDGSGDDEGAARMFPDVFKTERSTVTDHAELGGMDQIAQSSYSAAINFTHRISHLKQEQPADVTEDQPQFSFMEVDVDLSQPLDSTDSSCVDPLQLSKYEPHQVKREVEVKQEPGEPDGRSVGVDQHSSAELQSDQGRPQRRDETQPTPVVRLVRCDDPHWSQPDAGTNSAQGWQVCKSYCSGVVFRPRPSVLDNMASNNSGIKRKPLSIEDKIKIINKIDNNPKCSRIVIAKELNLPPSTVNTVYSQRVKHLDAAKHKAASTKKNKSSKYDAIDTEVLKWFEEVRASNNPVNGPMIREKAQAVAHRLGIDFTPSNGWIDRLKKRFGLTYKMDSGEANGVLDNMASHSSGIKRKPLSIEDKIKIISKIDNNPKCSRIVIAKELNLPPSTVNTVYSQRVKHLDAAKHRAASTKKNKTSKYDAIDTRVLKWIEEVRACNIPVNGPMIREKAQAVAHRLGIDFTPSNGWIDRLKKRFGLTYKMVSGEENAIAKRRKAGFVERTDDEVESSEDEVEGGNDEVEGGEDEVEGVKDEVEGGEEENAEDKYADDPEQSLAEPIETVDAEEWANLQEELNFTATFEDYVSIDDNLVSNELRTIDVIMDEETMTNNSDGVKLEEIPQPIPSHNEAVEGFEKFRQYIESLDNVEPRTMEGLISMSNYLLLKPP